MAISLTIDGAQVALKKGSSIEYVSENRIFTDADDYSLEIELPLAECPQNIAVFGHLTRKDIDTDKIFFNAVLQDTKFRKVGAVVITGITNESVKVQFLEKRSYQNFYPHFDETYIDELDLGEWPHIFPDNISSGGMSGPRPGWEDAVYMTPAQMWARWQDYTALPWVNNYSGNLQNCARWNASANKYEWKVVGDDDEDTDFTKGFSFQPNLLWLTKKICDALGYAYDFAKWENSDYKYLLVCNTLPYSWSNRRWAAALPHWTVNEFFMELENLLLMEFDIDHARNKVTSQLSSLVQAEMEIETAAIEKRYEREVSMAEGNKYKTKQLEKQKQKEVAKVKDEANRKLFAMQVIQAVAQTATAALNAYSSAAAIPVVGYIIAPIAAAMAVAAGMMQVPPSRSSNRHHRRRATPRAASPVLGGSMK